VIAEISCITVYSKEQNATIAVEVIKPLPVFRKEFWAPRSQTLFGNAVVPGNSVATPAKQGFEDKDTLIFQDWPNRSTLYNSAPRSVLARTALAINHLCGYAASMNVVSHDPKVLGGEPVFAGTRVPVKSLFDHLEAGDSIEEFLEGFPSVRREQVIAVLQEAREHASSAR
jgi:uncharacterized protein (DUF433 family)